MGWKDERRVKLDATHTSICKFQESDENWSRVRSRLSVVAKRLGLSIGVPDVNGLVKDEEEAEEGEVEDQLLKQRMEALR